MKRAHEAMGGCGRELVMLRGEKEKRWSKFEEETKKVHEAMQEHEEKMEEERAEAQSTIMRYSMSLEEEAKIALEWKLRNLGYDVTVTSFESPKVVEVDVFAAFDKYMLIGEAKGDIPDGRLQRFHRPKENNGIAVRAIAYHAWST